MVTAFSPERSQNLKDSFLSGLVPKDDMNKPLPVPPLSRNSGVQQSTTEPSVLPSLDTMSLTSRSSMSIKQPAPIQFKSPRLKQTVV